MKVFFFWQIGLCERLNIDLFAVFSSSDMDKLGKIRRHHWKERHKISKTAKFESNMSLIFNHSS